MILIDTHILIWWFKNQERLTAKAKKLLDFSKDKGGIYLSSMSIWEIAMLAKKGEIRFGKEVSEWIYDLESLDFIHFVPVDNYIALHSVMLPAFPHKDPVDRIILATAQKLDCPLVTSDKKLRNYKFVKTIW